MENRSIYKELFVGPLIPLLWSSGVMSSGSQSQSGKPYTHLTEERKKETLRKLNSNDMFSFYIYFVQGFPARRKHTCWGSSEEKVHYHGRGSGVSRYQQPSDLIWFWGCTRGSLHRDHASPIGWPRHDASKTISERECWLSIYIWNGTTGHMGWVLIRLCSCLPP